jgi:Domain of unknown function (DUF4349)/Putative zinc-finger
MITEVHFTAPEEIMALLDGELAADRARLVTAHLEECAECGEFAGILRSSTQAVLSWTVPLASANPDFGKRLADAARQASVQERSSGVSRWSAFYRRRWVAKAGVAALFIVVALISLRPMMMMKNEREASLGISAAAPTAPAPTGLNIREQLGMAGPQDRFTTSDGREESQRLSIEELKAQREALIDRLQEAQISSNLAVSPSTLSTPPTEQSQPMIARNVALSIVVKDFDFSRGALDAILARHHGYAASLNASTQQNAARSLHASLRVPAGELNAAVAELKSLGHVENETQAGEEVTQQHADLVARLKNSRETEQRLQAILLQRTGKISDVLAVEQEIARVRGEIEQMDAEQESLEHRVAFATIDLNLAEEYKAQIGSASPSISIRLHNAVVAGYRAVVESVVSVVLFVVEYGPSAMLWLAFLAPLTWFVYRRWTRATSLVS